MVLLGDFAQVRRAMLAVVDRAVAAATNGRCDRKPGDQLHTQSHCFACAGWAVRDGRISSWQVVLAAAHIDSETRFVAQPLDHEKDSTDCACGRRGCVASLCCVSWQARPLNEPRAASCSARRTAESAGAVGSVPEMAARSRRTQPQLAAAMMSVLKSHSSCPRHTKCRHQRLEQEVDGKRQRGRAADRCWTLAVLDAVPFVLSKLREPHQLAALTDTVAAARYAHAGDAASASSRLEAPQQPQRPSLGVLGRVMRTPAARHHSWPFHRTSRSIKVVRRRLLFAP